MKIYVGNLPYSVTEDELQSIFSDFGDIETVSIVIDKLSGQSKGFGFVEMPDPMNAEDAIRALNESLFQGRTLKVNEAKPRPVKTAKRQVRA